jgi:uncharacterized protein YbjT (DUF2867 family)
MHVVIIGGTGLIGKKLAQRLRDRGHTVTPASPSTGVNTITGVGLDTALAGAGCVVDVSNSPSFADQAVMDFFTTSTRNIASAAVAAGIGHYVALSVVGVEELPDSGYMRAKVTQERLVHDSGTAFSIVRATQFFEFIDTIANSATQDGKACVPDANMQPIAADDVASLLADRTLGRPANGTVEIAGPTVLSMADILRARFAATNDPRPVVVDSNAGYFGARVQTGSLVPRGRATLGSTRLEDWLRTSPAASNA